MTDWQSDDGDVYRFNSVIRASEEKGIIGFDEYQDLILARSEEEALSAFDLADGFIYCEGETLWFLPAYPFDVAGLGTPLLEALLWDIYNWEVPERNEWAFPTKTKTNVERLLAVLKQAQVSIEHALAHDVGEINE